MANAFTLTALVAASLLTVSTRPLCAQAAPFTPPPAATLARLGIDPKALATLLKRGADSHSDAIVIIKNDEVVGQWYSGRPQAPVEAMSVTKSVAALAIGCLLHDGKIKSLDQPVSDFYPEWKQGRKKLITLRQILDHTSGLQADRRTDDIYASPDFVQLALAAELVSDPGEEFFYNNKAVNLLAGIVQKASGQRMDSYISAHIFAPLGIRDYRWDTDTVGNVQVMAGLWIQAMDLAKIGQMLADDGIWHGTRIVDSEWIAGMTTQRSQSRKWSYGLLWWILPQSLNGTIDAGILRSWRQAGVPAVYADKASSLEGKVAPLPELYAKVQAIFGGQESIIKQLRSRQLPTMRAVAGPLVGYCAQGDLGQYLVVIPKEHLVAVRQISSDSFKSDDPDGFLTFLELVPALVGKTVVTASP